MSAFVCKDETFSSVVRLLERHNEIGSKNQLAQRLYLLNVESVNQRYDLSTSHVEEYKKYLKHTSEILYLESERTPIEDWIAARCWCYQSCEGDCDEDTLFNAVSKSCEKEAFRLVEELYKGKAIPSDYEQAAAFLWQYTKDNDIDESKCWG